MDDRTLRKLKKAVSLQNGEGGTFEEVEALEAATRGKIVWHRGADFGSQVRVIWRGDGEFEGGCDLGYLMGLPGANSPDMDGIVHIPHPEGEMDEDDPVWLTYSELAALPDVEKVIIGVPEKAGA